MGGYEGDGEGHEAQGHEGCRRGGADESNESHEGHEGDEESHEAQGNEGCRRGGADESNESHEGHEGDEESHEGHEGDEGHEGNEEVNRLCLCAGLRFLSTEVIEPWWGASSALLYQCW